MEIQIIVNPIAGGGRGFLLAHMLADSLVAGGAQVTLMETQKRGDATRFAKITQADCVVAVGGDGSVNEVVNGLDRPDGVVLAILPIGTANVIARELKIPDDANLLAKLILRHESRQIDVGLWGDKKFLLGAGGGLDAEVIRRVHENRGKRLSFLSYATPIWRTLLEYGFPLFRVWVDGISLCENAMYAVVGNCRYSAGVLPMTPEARPDDGWLDVCAFRDLTILRMLYLAGACHLKRFSTRNGVLYARGREVVFEPAGNESVPLQVDGDPAGNLPARFSIKKRALEIIAPNH